MIRILSCQRCSVQELLIVFIDFRAVKLKQTSLPALTDASEDATFLSFMKFHFSGMPFKDNAKLHTLTGYYSLQVVLTRCCPKPQPFHVGLIVLILPSTGTILSFTPGNVRFPALRSPLIRSITDSISSRTDTLLSLHGT